MQKKKNAKENIIPSSRCIIFRYWTKISPFVSIWPGPLATMKHEADMNIMALRGLEQGRKHDSTISFLTGLWPTITMSGFQTLTWARMDHATLKNSIIVIFVSIAPIYWKIMFSNSKKIQPRALTAMTVTCLFLSLKKIISSNQHIIHISTTIK